ncbi:MAG: chorismate-binding protein [Planctomycetota bacterium]
MPTPSRPAFVDLASRHLRALEPGQRLAIPVGVAVLADQLTPVLAYRRLVSVDERTAPSFLLESVEGGARVGRYSVLGAHPMLELEARGRRATIRDHRGGGERTLDADDAFALMRRVGEGFRLLAADAGSGLAPPEGLLGGWVGYAGYDAVRYAEPGKLPFEAAPADDRDLADVSFGLYDGVVVFDNVAKLCHVVQLAFVGESDDPSEAYDAALAEARRRCAQIEEHSKPLPLGRMQPAGPRAELASNITREQHAAMVERAREYIFAGDIFQVVLGQRFERTSSADPFDVYRALRVVNPSPYMVYMQTSGAILVASSPEILCRVRRDEADATALVVTNRPLAGTRRRGATPEEDAALERELLADHKELSEHAMLVDLGRNDVGKVAIPGTVLLDALMQIERYSHVMHISSTVTGRLRSDADAYDALRAALPVGTISGAPKVRAMQIIDELETIKRGPYGGGMGWIGLPTATHDEHPRTAELDVALTLRTIVCPIDRYVPPADGRPAQWTYHLQAAGGIVADSVAGAEYEETVNKAAALARALDLAEAAFGG